VALAFANHARGERAWVVTTRLMKHTGIRSRTTACGVVSSLVAAGWLVVVGPHPEHRQRIVYRLVVPNEAISPDPESTRKRRSDGRFAKKSGPGDGPVQEMDRSTSRTQTGPQTEHEPVQVMDETGPQDGTDSLRLSKDSHQDSPRERGLRPLDAIGATPDEEEILIKRITTANPRIGNLGAYLAAMHRSGDLAALLETIRAEKRAASVRQEVAAARHLPECEHGYPGGEQLHPGTERPLCPQCRLLAEGKRPVEDPNPRGGAAEVALPVDEQPDEESQVEGPATTPTPVGTCTAHPHVRRSGGIRPDGAPHCPLCRIASRTTKRVDVPAQRDEREGPGAVVLAFPAARSARSA